MDILQANGTGQRAMAGTNEKLTAAVEDYLDDLRKIQMRERVRLASAGARRPRPRPPAGGRPTGRFCGRDALARG